VYSRVRQGLEVAAFEGRDVRWVVFPTGPDSPLELHGPFRAFVMRARREFGVFEYAVTHEVGALHGMRHLNVLWIGEYMEQRWVDDQWWAVARARHVHIERVQCGGAVASYVSKYVTKDPQAIRGVWYSAGWLGSGETGEVARWCRDKNRWDVWRTFLEGGSVTLCYEKDQRAALFDNLLQWRLREVVA
jgi:hypothetical protein